jgi:lysozyme family protein
MDNHRCVAPNAISNMTDFIDTIIKREGGDTETNDPDDSGGRTKFGISENAHPEAWADGDVSYWEARTIYERVYILAEKFHLIRDEHLKHQVVDFGVPSGPDTAARLLQQLVGVKVDGVIGPKTLAAIDNYPDGKLFGVEVPGRVLLNLAFRDAREIFYATLAKRRPKDLKFLLGWLKRAQEFR